jgi:plasmid stability protein
MATLQVRDIDDRLYSYLKTSARIQNRSISQEVVSIIEAYLNSPRQTTTNATLEFLSLSGAWKDERSEEEIVRDLRSGRIQSNRFGVDHGIFD